MKNTEKQFTRDEVIERDDVDFWEAVQAHDLTAAE